MASWGLPDERKLAEFILYVAGKIEKDPTGGVIKLNKILYFAETSHVRSHGVPITGGPYRKLPMGPAPTAFVQIRDRLIARGDAEKRQDEYFGYGLERLVPLRDADTRMFSPSELAVIDQVVDALWGKNSNEVSDLSHKEKGFQLAEEKEEIPLYTAYLPPEPQPPSKAVRRRAARLIRERWGTGK